MLRPKISIIIPVYNSSNYLTICLDSIINQSFKDFEVICVNDGSTDNSLDILKTYSAKDSRIIIINQVNQGQGIARNNAINIAKGDFIVFVDSDDSLASTNSLELMFNSISSSNSDIVVFRYNKASYTKLRTIDFSTSLINRNLCSLADKKELLSENNFISPWNKIYRRNFIIENNIFFAEKVIYEDVLFFFQVVLLAKKISFLDRVLYTYVRHPQSTMAIRSKKNQDIIKVYSLIKDFLVKYRLLEEISNLFVEHVFSSLYIQFKKTPLKYKRDFFNKMKPLVNEFEVSKYFKFKIPYIKYYVMRYSNFFCYFLFSKVR